VLLGSFLFQAEDGIRDRNVTGVQTCALPIFIYGHKVNSFPCKCSPPSIERCLCVQRDSLFHPRSCRGFPPPKRQQNRPPRPRIRVCFREMAWVNSVSGVLHPFLFFGVFPCVWVFPTPSYHMLCNYHTSFRVTPTTHSLTHSLTPPRRSLTNTQASPHRHARRPGQRPPPQPTPSNTQQAHPSTTKVVHQQATQTT